MSNSIIDRFRTLLRSTYKSMDTEENIDRYFTRPIGLVLTLVCKWLGIHPNAVTIFSFFLGIAAGWMFLFTDLWHNVCGILLFMCANFCDSVDGQLARMTNKRTLTGRMLDGFASDVWYAAAYVAICLRLQNDCIPGLEAHWGIGIWLLCSLAGFICHTRQCRLSDYYRQIHLFFLLGKDGAELNSYESQKAIADKYRKEKNYIGVLFFANYAKYCHAQEAMTPEFQKLKARLTDRYGSLDNVPQEFRDEFRRHSLPLMKYANFLTHNWRAFMLFIGCLINQPWIYPLFEVTVMVAAYVHMHRTHEHACKILCVTEQPVVVEDDTIRAYLFDFGGTIDTQGDHWGRVLWHAYERQGVQVTEEQFREAYVYAERKLGKEDIIQPHFTYRQTLAEKIRLQLAYLQTGGAIPMTDSSTVMEGILNDVYGIVCSTAAKSRATLEAIKEKGYPIVLVSNFYGNMHAVLRELDMLQFFDGVVESAVVGIRKPDTHIYIKGIEVLKKVNGNLRPENICMVGDSIDKDILPASSLGCHTIRIKGEPWTASPDDEKAAEREIDCLEQII